ncbi:MAG: putative Ig domain-containing protein [Opitutaceae bacterium]|nr:putative Ig domain-containing protein [Opitutaceae bacterium]
MPAYDFPQFTDGRRGVRSPTVKCYNILSGGNPIQLHYIDDDIKGSSFSLDHILEGDGEHLGGYTKASIRSGTLNVQLDKADDTEPMPGHVIGLTKKSVEGFYQVREASFPGQRNNVVRGALNLVRIVNPFFTGLLSEDEGDTKRVTYSIAAMGTTETIDPQPVNHRTGATKAYSATLSSGAALPAGIAINASTGVITITKADVVAGVSTIKVVATDTLTNKRTLEGEATLVLTITA